MCIGEIQLCDTYTNIIILLTFQILMNASWEYMTAVGMLFVLTLLGDSTVLAKTTSLGMEDPV